MATATRRTVQLESLTRSVWHFQRPGADPLILGDKRDTDEEVAAALEGLPRNEVLTPHPIATLSPEDWDKLGEGNHKLIDELVRQKQIKRIELAT